MSLRAARRGWIEMFDLMYIYINVSKYMTVLCGLVAGKPLLVDESMKDTAYTLGICCLSRRTACDLYGCYLGTRYLAGGLLFGRVREDCASKMTFPEEGRIGRRASLCVIYNVKIDRPDGQICLQYTSCSRRTALLCESHPPLPRDQKLWYSHTNLPHSQLSITRLWTIGGCRPSLINHTYFKYHRSFPVPFVSSVHSVIQPCDCGWVDEAFYLTCGRRRVMKMRVMIMMIWIIVIILMWWWCLDFVMIPISSSNIVRQSGRCFRCFGVFHVKVDDNLRLVERTLGAIKCAPTQYAMLITR